MKLETIKKFIRFKRPEYEEKVVCDIALLFLRDDFPKNNIILMCEAIRYMDYAFSLGCT